MVTGTQEDRRSRAEVLMLECFKSKNLIIKGVEYEKLARRHGILGSVVDIRINCLPSSKSVDT